MMSTSRKSRSLFFLFLNTCLCIALLGGCSLKMPSLFKKSTPISDLPAEALFIDKDEIYNQTLKLIQSAKSSIYVQQAEFDDHDPQLIQLLMNKSQAGLDVRILLDQWQTINQSTRDQLKSQNVSIQFYPAQKGQIDHTKYLIIDHSTALIYGPSWTAAGLQAHDLAVELTGKSAWRTATLFSKDWEFATTASLPVPQTTTLPDDNIIIATNANVKQQLTEQISSSKNSILIAVPEISDADLIQALLDASEKVPEVHLILDREVMTSNAPASLAKLKSKNIQIRYYPREPQLGLRLAVFDNACFILTSFDWTRNAFVTHHEFSITVPSPAASAKLGDLFQQDWAKSTE